MNQEEHNKQTFLRVVSIKKTWAYLDADLATSTMAKYAGAGINCRDRVVAAIGELEKHILVQGTGVVSRFTVRKVPTAVELRKIALAEYRRFRHQERNDLQRLDDVILLATGIGGCQCATMMRHFGENVKPAFSCNGACAVCRPGRITISPPDKSQVTKPPAAEWQRVTTAAKSSRELLENPRLLARFAVGGKSPMLTKLKLVSHAAFGCCLGLVPWEVLLAHAEQLCGIKDDHLEIGENE